ncbi:unnamed protein product [Microthlaspi erraticum]|uniref:Uncharacterized protein n=1 Tax=Microthlaspi erraticum TaxID=1685480 RepID=A0A6D2J0L9_9BRAS|nr:unnamed protein product [Microthlaspi erraticum]
MADTFLFNLLHQSSSSTSFTHLFLSSSMSSRPYLRRLALVVILICPSLLLRPLSLISAVSPLSPLSREARISSSRLIRSSLLLRLSLPYLRRLTRLRSGRI